MTGSTRHFTQVGADANVRIRLEALLLQERVPVPNINIEVRVSAVDPSLGPPRISFALDTDGDGHIAFADQPGPAEETLLAHDALDRRWTGSLFANQTDPLLWMVRWRYARLGATMTIRLVDQATGAELLLRTFTIGVENSFRVGIHHAPVGGAS